MKVYTTVSVLALAAVIAACGGTTTTPNVNSGSNAAANTTNSAPTNVAAANTDGVRKPEAATTNNAPTLGPVFLAYYDALRKKDDIAVRSLLSADLLRKWEADLKEQNRKDLSVFIAEIEDLNAKIEVRNEEINGNKAFIEVKGGVYVNWSSIGLVNEGGKWKLSNESKEIQRVDSQGK